MPIQTPVEEQNVVLLTQDNIWFQVTAKCIILLFVTKQFL
jgi:hypothetical protein